MHKKIGLFIIVASVLGSLVLFFSIHWWDGYSFFFNLTRGYVFAMCDESVSICGSGPIITPYGVTLIYFKHAIIFPIITFLLGLAMYLDIIPRFK